MKFLVDTQLPAALARWLTARGCDAVHVLDRGMGQASDTQLWQDCLTEGRIMISKDEDFFFLASRPGDTGCLLWLRVGNCRRQALLATLEKHWSAIAAAFAAGEQIVEIRQH
jgi:predicted nuclease of predicted toxin-antitoxin system